MSEDLSVKVAVRVRPLVPTEISKGCRDIVDVIQQNEQIIIKRTDKDNYFTFNYVLSNQSTQLDLYSRCVQPLIEKLFKGYNVTIFAYGQTGSGKTHSMGTSYKGEDEDAGVIPRAVRDIFNYKKDNFCYDFVITVSFMELYQEVLYDLLSEKDREQCVLEIREDPKKGIHIPGLTEIPVESVQDVLDTLLRGSLGRVTGSTAMNSQSSRSHAIFTLNISMNHKTDLRENKQAKLNLVDLAGSERPKKTGAIGTTFKEGVNINKGLFVLGNVISCLGDDQKQNGFIPYRDSNLTRLLKDSLGGNSITLMIACVSPADYNLDETLSTLRYADRARKIKNKPVVNQDAKVAEILELKKTIQQLRLQIVGQGGPIICPAEIELLQKEIADYKMRLKKITIQLSNALMDNTCLHERIILLQSVNETLNKKIAVLKEQCNTTFDNISIGITNNDTDMVKDNITKLQTIHNEFLQINTEQRETEEEIRFHEKAFNDNLVMAKNTVSNDDQSNELIQQQETHATRQIELNDQLQEIHKKLVLKESLARTLAINNQNMVDIKEMKENEEKINTLEKEKEELLRKLKNAGTGSGSENFRKRIQELESQLTLLNRKVKEQARLIEHKNKSEQKIKLLDQEILQMKQAKVKLIRAMREEADKFKQWKLNKERECHRLKQQERKKEQEIVKMKVIHSKQQTVFKRRVEEAEALNKRLKNALALRKQVADSKKTGQADKIEPWLKQEYELFINTVEAETTLKLLLNDRAVLKQQLDDIKSNPDELPSDEVIKSIEDDIELRSVQIQDLQTKILDSDEENRAKTRFDKIQSMSDAKHALKFLFTQAEQVHREKVQTENKLKDLQDTVEEFKDKLNARESDYTKSIESLMKEMVEQQKEYEDKIHILLRVIKDGNHSDTGSDDALNDIYKIQQEKIESQEEQIKQLQEELNKPKLLNVTFATTPENNVAKKPQKIKTATSTLAEDDFVLLKDVSLELDNPDKDPDWRKTPIGKRILDSKRLRQGYYGDKSAIVTGNKRSSDGGCTCRVNCSGRCGCRRVGKGCNSSCKCASRACENRDTENVLPSTTTTTDESAVDQTNEEFDDIKIPKKRSRKKNSALSSPN